MSVVSDSSPLIALERIERTHLLHILYDRILVPPAVDREVYASRRQVAPDWIDVRPLSTAPPPEVAAADLGAGEKEAIALALEVHSALLLLDDLPARSLARLLGLPVVGVGGMLVAAKRLGHVAMIAPLLGELAKAGFRMSDALRVEILRLAGEHPDLTA